MCLFTKFIETHHQKIIELSKWYINDEGDTLIENDFCISPEMEQDLEHFLVTKEQFFSSGIYLEGIKTLHNSLISKIDTKNMQAKN